MNDSLWTPERVADLLDLHGRGFSASAISQALGAVSRSAVIGKIHRLGMQKGRQTRAAARLRAMLARGASEMRPPRAFERSTVRVDSPSPMSFLAMPDQGHCRFPIHEEDEPFLYCGNPSQPNRSYCPGHHLVAYDRERTQEAASQHAQRVRDWLVGTTPRPGRTQSMRPR